MKRKKHITSIKTKIFLSYGSVILVLILLAIILYYFTSYSTFLKNYTTSSKQLSKIVSGQIDWYIEEINSLQKKFLESDAIRDYIFEYSLMGDPSRDRDFHRMVYMITGYDMSFHHINILNLEDNLLIPFGTRYTPLPYEITSEVNETIILPATRLRGAKYILPTGKGTLYDTDKTTKTLSLIRSFPRYSDSLSDPKGIIEMQISISKIEQLINDMLLSYDNKAEYVYIFNEDNDLIFPVSLSADLTAFYTELHTAEKALLKNPVNGNTELITAYTSSATGFTTYIVTPESSLAGNRKFFRNIALLIGFVSLSLLITITYSLAKSISSPIIKLKESISHLELTAINEDSVSHLGSNLNELELLDSAYHHMQLRLKQSLDDIVQAKTLSIHSQIMALQAQMDSHFLYNTLTIISIIAEENNDFPASEMCLKLTRMLRYITEDYSMTTTFKEELSHAENYTDLMKIRFGEKIQFQYETDDLLSSFPVPRLIIQPLIENCVKYSRNDDHVLKISIVSYREANYWYTRITDNGSGFTPEARKSIFDKIEKLNSNTGYPQIMIDGMGMANIYLRLKLFYGEDFVFEIDTPKQGATVLIGGKQKNDT